MFSVPWRSLGFPCASGPKGHCNRNAAQQIAKSNGSEPVRCRVSRDASAAPYPAPLFNALHCSYLDMNPVSSPAPTNAQERINHSDNYFIFVVCDGPRSCSGILSPWSEDNTEQHHPVMTCVYQKYHKSKPCRTAPINCF